MDYKEKYHELLKDFWHVGGVVANEMRMLDHMGSKADSVCLEVRSALQDIAEKEGLDNNFLNNKPEEQEKTVKKYRELRDKKIEDYRK